MTTRPATDADFPILSVRVKERLGFVRDPASVNFLRVF